MGRFWVAYLLISVAFTSGMVVLGVAGLGPRPPQDSSTEINYFPFNMPTGKLEDTDGLAGILTQYHELLRTFGTSLDTALGPTPFNPYLPLPQAFLRDFQAYRPSFLRQARISSRQFDQVPNALTRDLAGASTVLAELDKLTAAQLTAIEECHRVNIRRLRQRSFLRWELWSKIIAVGATLVAAVGYGVTALDKVAGIKPGDLWAYIGTIDLTGVASSLTLWGVFLLVMVVVFVITNLITFLPILRRVRAFEDVLTIAKAYRKEERGE
jgi:hypothetical protein